jgi:hypothetical protein
MYNFFAILGMLYQDTSFNLNVLALMFLARRTSNGDEPSSDEDSQDDDS